MTEEFENNQDGEAVVRGVLARVTYRNPTNGYSVLKLDLPETRDQITVVGTCLDVNVGAHLMIRGSYIAHPKFGRQLKASSISETTPSSSFGIQKYLSSGLIKGIGEKTAERLVAEYGERALEMITQEPEKVAALPGVGRKKADLMMQAIKGSQQNQEIMRFLLEHNISSGLAMRIYERYQNRAVEILSRDPYVLARDMRGVGFVTADSIAMNLGLKPDSPQRLKAGVYYALEKACDDGHCFLPRRLLEERARTLLDLSEEYDLDPAVQSLIQENYLVLIEDIGDEPAIYLRHLERAEEFVGEFIALRAGVRETPDLGPEFVEDALNQGEKSLGITFSFEQRQAVLDATRHNLLVITGGPGCGKTTIIRALSLLYTLAGKRLLLAAPTGRAAQRMSQVCELPASTIHRMLKYDPNRSAFKFGIGDPLQADAIIIDEASMLDIQLAKDLFCAIPKNATLILVGDKDQLPSVGPGRVFADVISVRDVKTVALSQLFRRSEESNITTIAHMINSGIVPEIPEPDGVTRADAYFIARSDAEEAARTIENLVADQLPRKFGVEAHEIMVLTPSNRGPLGTIALNKRLQQRLNPPGALDSEQELEVGETSLRLRDRVCQRVNNYNIDEVGVFNGDAGQVYSVDRGKRSVTVELWDGRLVKYSDGDLHQLSLAYAITVHRSQGSEIPCVVLALHESHFTLLERQLLYTAVTRAKKLLIVVGSKKSLAMASKRMSAKRRCTLLKERVEHVLKK